MSGSGKCFRENKQRSRGRGGSYLREGAWGNSLSSDI